MVVLSQFIVRIFRDSSGMRVYQYHSLQLLGLKVVVKFFGNSVRIVFPVLALVAQLTLVLRLYSMNLDMFAQVGAFLAKSLSQVGQVKIVGSG